MSEWRDYKQAFISGLLSGQPNLGPVPPRITERWARKLHSVGEPTWPGQRRLANRFKLGADPEFVVSDGRTRLDATAFGMVTGAFIGADQNGRLAEVRPCPSRSALEVTASIWLELEMGNRLYDLGRYQLLSGAYVFNDGLGGHIHVGRKRPWRANEVNALDALYFTLLELGVFPADQQALRQGGDQHRQQYGLPADFRPQAHGYEYRTLPSFLDSPALTFISLTLAKCVILGRQMVAFWHSLEQRPIELIQNLLAFYAPVDDDARLAYHIVKIWGLPKYIGGDFKARWAMHRRPAADVPAARPQLLPGNLKPSAAWVEHLFEHLKTGRPLVLRGLPVPTVRTTLPTGSVYLANGEGQGTGDVVAGLVTPRGLPLEIRAASQPATITVTYTLAEALGAERLRKLCAKMPLVKQADGSERRVQFRVLFGDTRFKMYIPEALRAPGTASLTRRALASGVLPIYDGTKVEVVPQWTPPRAGKGRYL